MHPESQVRLLGVLRPRSAPHIPGITFESLLVAVDLRPDGTSRTGKHAKTGIPGPFGVKNGYSLESSQKRTPRATQLAKTKSYPLLRDDSGTRVNAYYARLTYIYICFFCELVALKCAPVFFSLLLRPFFSSFGFNFSLRIGLGINKNNHD